LRGTRNREASPRISLFILAADPDNTKRSGALETDIRRWTNEWNENPKPFVWTKSADEILENLAVYCSRITDSGH
jgi:hypothetical protein